MIKKWYLSAYDTKKADESVGPGTGGLRTNRCTRYSGNV